MAHQLELNADRLKGATILAAEIVSDESGDYIVVYLPGMRLYADSPTLYSDDSGDDPAEWV